MDRIVRQTLIVYSAVNAVFNPITVNAFQIRLNIAPQVAPPIMEQLVRRVAIVATQAAFVEGPILVILNAYRFNLPIAYYQAHLFSQRRLHR